MTGQPHLHLGMNITHYLSPCHFTLLMISKVISGFLCCSNGVGTEASLPTLLAQDSGSHPRTHTGLLPHEMSKTDNDRERKFDSEKQRTELNRLMPFYLRIPQKDNHPLNLKGSTILERNARKPNF